MNRQSVILLVLIVLPMATGCSTPDALPQLTPKPTVAPQPTPTPAQMPIHGDAPVGVLAWEDLNGNGTRDEGEPPLAHVGIDFSYFSRAYTDADGYWGTVLFGGATYGDLTIHAIAPAGYTATTKTEVDCCRAEFGFMRVDISPSLTPTMTVGQ